MLSFVGEFVVLIRCANRHGLHLTISLRSYKIVSCNLNFCLGIIAKFGPTYLLQDFMFTDLICLIVAGHIFMTRIFREKPWEHILNRKNKIFKIQGSGFMKFPICS
jgi:hypothetical protein